MAGLLSTEKALCRRSARVVPLPALLRYDEYIKVLISGGPIGELVR